jgi:hypothetical protein
VSAEDIWDVVSKVQFDNEASVETRLVLPLLASLGYAPEDVAPKFPVVFREGSKGRKHEADFVVFANAERTRDASLFVVEVKHPGEPLDDAKGQAESYSNILRTPVYIVTNGSHFQIWQMQTAQESLPLIDTQVVNLAANRGRIEILLAKPALIKLCNSLELKAIRVGPVDLSAYLRHTEARCHSGLRISRRLQHLDRVISSTDVLPLGTSIYISGESGLGKSDLSRELVLHQASALATGVDPRPPVRVDLPDVAIVGRGLLSYVHDRLRAHVPSVDTDHAFRYFIASTGIVLIADGYDRVPLAARPSILAESRALLDDFPRLQIVLLGRDRVEPAINALEHAALLPLSPEEQRQLAERADASFALRNLGAPLDRLCESPYFLQLVLADVRATRRTPSDLVPLFRRWLDRLLSADEPDTATRLCREEAMKVLATATVGSSIMLSQAVGVLDAHKLQQSTLDDLIRLGAVTGIEALELQHEIVADFLRAEAFVSKTDRAVLPAEISSMNLESGSAFPILLAALLPSRDAQRALWRRLLRIGPPLYLTALRYRADASAVSLTSREAQEALLEDIVESVDDFLDMYMPELGPTIRAHLSGDDGDVVRLSIRGKCWDDRTVTYAYALGQMASTRVTVTDVVAEANSSSGRGFRGQDLLLSGMRRDGGREIGTHDLRAILKTLVKNFELEGGVVWSREYLWSVLPTIAWSDQEDPTALPIHELRARLETSNGCVPNSNYDLMPVSPILAALDVLIAAGDLTVSQHHLKLDTRTRDGILEFTRQKYDRAISAYRDLVSRYFSQVAAHLRHFPQMPIRFDVAVGLGGGIHDFIEYARWAPVPTWNAATVVSWADEPPRSLVDEDSVRWMRRSLEALDRPTTTISFGGWDGRIHDEFGATAVARQVTEWLMDDVHYLFRPMGVDWPS